MTTLALAGNAVLRVPVLYGPIEYTGESAVTVLYDKVADNSVSCLMDHRQRRFPTHTNTVANLVSQMLSAHQQKVGFLFVLTCCQSGAYVYFP